MKSIPPTIFGLCALTAMRCCTAAGHRCQLLSCEECSADSIPQARRPGAHEPPFTATPGRRSGSGEPQQSQAAPVGDLAVSFGYRWSRCIAAILPVSPQPGGKPAKAGHGSPAPLLGAQMPYPHPLIDGQMLYPQLQGDFAGR